MQILCNFKIQREKEAVPSNISAYAVEMVKERFHDYGYTRGDITPALNSGNDIVQFFVTKESRDFRGRRYSQRVFSTALHKILTGQMRTLAFTGFFECFGDMAANPQHLRLFLCSQGFILILAIVFFLTNMQPCQSHLDAVTPDIQTPAAVGQYQHGSAKWLTDKEKARLLRALSLTRTMNR